MSKEIVMKAIWSPQRGLVNIEEATADELRRSLLLAVTDRDRWRKIADRLVAGAEHQIDDLGGPNPMNEYWSKAWRAYDEAVTGES